MKTIAQKLKITEFPFAIKDSNNNRIYLEDSNGKIEDIYSGEYFSIRDFVNSNKGTDKIIAKLYKLNIEDVDDNLDGELGYDTEVIRKVLKGKGYRVTYNDDTEYIIVKRYKTKLKIMKTIAQQLKVTEFPFEIRNKNGNRIYWEDSKRYWLKKEYDSNNNRIYFEDSNSYWVKQEYDSNNNEIYFEDSNGYWSKQEFDSNNNRIYWENSDGYWEEQEYDSNNNVIYFENSDGYWEKSEYDSNNNRIYFENSDGYIIDNRPKSTPEYTMEELVEKLGFEFKIKK